MSISHASQSEEAESKYLYFILGVSTATLAYALEHGQPPSYDIQYALYLFAVFSWLFSFFLGLRAVHRRLDLLNLMANSEQLSESIQMARKSLPVAMLSQMETQYMETITNTNIALNNKSKQFQTYLSWQFRLIMLGAAAYTAWRLAPMATRFFG